MANRHQVRRASETDSTDAELVNDITLTLLRVINKIQLGRRTALAHSGAALTLVEIEVCTLIGRHEGITGGELSVQLAVTRSATSQVIRKLKEKGYVVDESDHEDAKRKRLFLTERALSAVAMADHYSEMMKREVFNVSRAELDSYKQFLIRLEEFHDRVSRSRNV